MSEALKAFLTESQSARLKRILDATLRLIAEVGAQQMTMRDVAASSEVSPATLYNRFGNKDNLVALAVADELERRIRIVVGAHATNNKPLETVVYHLELLATVIKQYERFAYALVSAYFKLNVERQMTNQLLAVIHDSWSPVINEMNDNHSLRNWVSVPLMVEEISNRELEVIMRLAQQAFPPNELTDRLIIAIVSVILGASRGKLAREAENILAGAIGRIACPAA